MKTLLIEALNEGAFGLSSQLMMPAGSLATTDDLVEQVLRTNSYLRRASGSPRREVIDGARALSLSLSGRSPLTGQDERVTVFTRELPEGDVLYSLLIAPSRDYGDLDRTFDRMVRSLRVDDRAAHR